jgi:hypothetical protein
MIVGALPWAANIGGDTLRIGASMVSILASVSAMAVLVSQAFKPDR